MVVHRERLNWFGNFNWLLRQPLCEFFCYRQHDDTTAPQVFEVLLNEPPMLEGTLRPSMQTANGWAVVMTSRSHPRSRAKL